MSTLTQGIRTYLLSKSAVTSVTGTRVYSDFMPQNNAIYPAIFCSQVSQLPAHTLETGGGYAESRVQIDVFANHASDRDSLVEVLRNELQGFPQNGEGSALAATATSIVYRGSRDLYEPPTDNSDKGLFRNSTDYWVRHLQAVPSFA